MAKAELFQKDIPENETDDPIKTDEQEKKIEVGLPEGYEFIPKHWWVRAYSSVLFRIFWIFGQWYERRYWQGKFYGREKLKKARGKGYVVYANHTNPFHDVFGPAIEADFYDYFAGKFKNTGDWEDFAVYRRDATREI